MLETSIRTINCQRSKGLNFVFIFPHLVGDPRGVQKCSQYGDSFLQVSALYFMLRVAFHCADNVGSMKFPS